MTCYEKSNTNVVILDVSRQPFCINGGIYGIIYFHLNISLQLCLKITF